MYHRKPKFETRIETWPKNYIRPYGESTAVFSEEKRKKIRWLLLGIQKENSMEKQIPFLEFNCRKFYQIVQNKEQENLLDVIDKISSSEFDGEEVTEPVIDYWSYQINKEGEIVSKIVSSSQGVLPYQIPSVLHSDYAYYRNLRVEELFALFKQEENTKTLKK